MSETNYLSLKTSYKFLEHYFETGFLLNIDNIPNNDLCILMHSNKVCVVTLAKSHFLLNILKDDPIESVDFQSGPNTNRLNNSVKGKGKKGGQYISSKGTDLLKVVTKSKSVLTIPSGIKGKLLEVNRRLVSEPELLFNCPLTEGFLCIIQPSVNDFESIKASLASREDFEKLRSDFV